MSERTYLWKTPKSFAVSRHGDRKLPIAKAADVHWKTQMWDVGWRTFSPSTSTWNPVGYSSGPPLGKVTPVTLLIGSLALTNCLASFGMDFPDDLACGCNQVGRRLALFCKRRQLVSVSKGLISQSPPRLTDPWHFASMLLSHVKKKSLTHWIRQAWVTF